MSQRVALITGSGKRIGAATASLLLSEGWFVFLHVRNSIDEARNMLKELSLIHI